MKFLVLAVIAFVSVHGAPVDPDPDAILPYILIARAQDTIAVAEGILEYHVQNGNRRFTQAYEAQIEELRILVRELEQLEASIHVARKVRHNFEERLLHAINRLNEEGLAIEHRVIEEKHNVNPEEKDIIENVLPAELIKRASELIYGAEYELKNHYAANLTHLTEGLEREVVQLKNLVKEVETLEKDKVVPLHRLHEFLERLQRSEDRLAEEELFIFNRHDEEIHKDDLDGGF